MKKPGLLILCNLLIYAVELKAQHIINGRIKNELNEMKVDTALVYSIACVGCSTLDSCKKEANHYVFWRKNGQYYIKRYDYCKTYNKIELSKTNPLSFYLLNKNIIEKEKIKQPTYKKIVKNGDKVDTQLISHYMEDSENYDLSVFLNEKVLEIHFDVNNVGEQFDKDGNKNIYYASNRKTRLFALVNKIEGLISSLNKKEKWLAENSSQCIKKEQITYGGDWEFNEYILNCPTYQFTYSGDTSTNWNYLTDPIDIMQAPKEVLQLKKYVDEKIKSYAGADFFSKVNFKSVEVVYPDSLKAFIDNGVDVSLTGCKAKYFFYYEFRPDTISVYHIGIAVNKEGKIISKFNFPAEKDYRPFDSTFTYCKIIAIARKVQKRVDPIKEISLQYDSKQRRFYWLIVQDIVTDGKGIGHFNTVNIDAIDLKKVTLSKRMVYVDY